MALAPREWMDKAKAATRALGVVASNALVRSRAAVAPHLVAAGKRAAEFRQRLTAALRATHATMRSGWTSAAVKFGASVVRLSQRFARLRGLAAGWIARATAHRPSRGALRVAGYVSVALVGALVCFSSSPEWKRPEPKAEDAKTEGPWILAWSDEFEGTELDRSKWHVDTTTEYEPPFGDSYFADSPATIRVGNGVLELRAEPIGLNKYSGAMLQTQGIASWQYGRFEARVKVAQGKGVLTSFWMMHKDPTLEKFPEGGEIDILEQLGREPKYVEAALHYKGVDTDRHHLRKKFDKPVGDEFHDFAIEWTPEGFFWFIDGVMVHSYPPHNDHPFNRDFFVILSLCVGGDWALAPDENTKFPVTAQVDWVRVYAINPNYVRPDREARALIAQDGIHQTRARSRLY